MKRLYVVLSLLLGATHCQVYSSIGNEALTNTQAFLRAFDNPNINEQDLINFLNACNIDVHVKNGKKQTTLMLAARRNYENLTKILIRKNVNVNAQDHKRKTALMFASGNGSLNAVTALVGAGAKANLKDYHGYTARDYARRKNLDLDFVKAMSQFTKSKSPELIEAKYVQLMTQKQLQQQGRQNVFSFLGRYKDIEDTIIAL